MISDAAELVDRFSALVGADHVLAGEAIKDDYTHDEALAATPRRPLAVVVPATTDEVAAVLRAADEHGVPVTARGAGTGLSGACIPQPDGIVVSFERMAAIVEIDTENFVAVVEPGVQLDQLDEALAPLGLVYPVFPGEYSASLGGNVSTNAGGMRAVKYGVTRHHVLGARGRAAVGRGDPRGGKVVKVSTGYDLTQLIIGSEGTLALVTEATSSCTPGPRTRPPCSPRSPRSRTSPPRCPRSCAAASGRSSSSTSTCSRWRRPRPMSASTSASPRR